MGDWIALFGRSLQAPLFLKETCGHVTQVLDLSLPLSASDVWNILAVAKRKFGWVYHCKDGNTTPMAFCVILGVQYMIPVGLFHMQIVLPYRHDYNDQGVSFLSGNVRIETHVGIETHVVCQVADPMRSVTRVVGEVTSGR